MQMPHSSGLGHQLRNRPSRLQSLQKTPVLHSSSANGPVRAGQRWRRLPPGRMAPFLEQGQLHLVEGGQSLSRPLYLAYLEKSDRRDDRSAQTLPLGLTPIGTNCPVKQGDLRPTCVFKSVQQCKRKGPSGLCMDIFCASAVMTTIVGLGQRGAALRRDSSRPLARKKPET